MIALEVGIDMTLISRFESRKERFIRTILTEKEYQVYAELPSQLKPRFLATRWACKEAIFKATQDQHYLEYSILNDEKGKPYVWNHLEMKVSISHEKDTVIAIVIVNENSGQI